MSETTAAGPARRPGDPADTRRHELASGWRSLAAVYGATVKTTALKSLQYRANLLIESLLMLGEPIVYLMVWRIVADESGGSVDGFTANRFAAYYIAFSLVRAATTPGSPLNWERWVRDGRMSMMLVRPIHPIHQSLAMWLGHGISRAIAWLPFGVILVVAFDPQVDLSIAQVVAVPLVLLGALALRVVLNDLIGMSGFWTTSVIAISGTFSVIESILGGRLLPIELLPQWMQWLSAILPFRWATAFPIEVMIGPMSGTDVAVGIVAQAAWIVATVALMRFVWRRGVRRYGAVGG